MSAAREINMTAETVLTDKDIRDKKYNLGVIAPDEFFNKIARAIEQAVLQSPEVQRLRRDSDLLNAIETECWDVRFGSSANADAGDSNITIEIVAHFMGEPRERVVGENHNEKLRPALEQAMTADAYPPARPEYEDDEP